MFHRIFTNVEEASQFANTNGIEGFNEVELSTIPANLNDYVIPNLSEVVRYHLFIRNREGWQHKESAWGVKDIRKDNIYKIQSKGLLKFMLKRLPEEDTEFARRFVFDKPTPKSFHIPTEKDIRAWFDYCEEYNDAFNQAKRDFHKKTMEEYHRILDKSERVKNCVEDEDLGVLSAFTAYKSPLRVEYKVQYPYGGYARDIFIDWDKASAFLDE